MLNTPRGNRLHIAIIGKRNVGKSSLINSLTGQNIALVSDMPGTTTDPVYKPMELLPLGPVVFIDTPGYDDVGELGALRLVKTLEIMDKTDLALLVVSAGQENITQEKKWLEELTARRVPVIGVVNRIDEADSNIEELRKELKIPFAKVSAKFGTNISELFKLIINNTPKDYLEDISLVSGLVKEGDVVLLVTPQNTQAPKGRMILPQVQVIRDILDHHGLVYVITDDEMEKALSSLLHKPDLVITDSQVFAKVNKAIPKEIPLVSFSILLARLKGDLNLFVKGAEVIDDLKPDDKVLIVEACTHHPLDGDIGREKLPQWLEKKAGGPLNVTVIAGNDFPIQLEEYKLILHCGSCMLNRKQVLSRIISIKEQQVPITNYGVAIAKIHGILDRVMETFNN